MSISETEIVPILRTFMQLLFWEPILVLQWEKSARVKMKCNTRAAGTCTRSLLFHELVTALQTIWPVCKLPKLLMARSWTLSSAAEVDLQTLRSTSQELQSAHFHLALKISDVHMLVFQNIPKVLAVFWKYKFQDRVKASIHKTN